MQAKAFAWLSQQVFCIPRKPRCKTRVFSDGFRHVLGETQFLLPLGLLLPTPCQAVTPVLLVQAAGGCWPQKAKPGVQTSPCSYLCLSPAFPSLPPKSQQPTPIRDLSLPSLPWGC